MAIQLVNVCIVLFPGNQKVYLVQRNSLFDSILNSFCLFYTLIFRCHEIYFNITFLSTSESPNPSLPFKFSEQNKDVSSHFQAQKTHSTFMM
jgi:hypothetical protein